jgi:hypothetical protein
MKAAQKPSALRSFKGRLKLRHPSARRSKPLFVWRRLLHDPAGSVIVIPSPHGEYKSGISYNDAVAAGEIYANRHIFGSLEVRTPELLGDEIGADLILIGGKKVNTVARDFQSLKHATLSFDLDDGVTYDKDKQVLLTPEYVTGKQRTTANVKIDYGLIVYTDNPFGKSTKILQLAGIKGFGTLAAAFALVDPDFAHAIDRILARLTSNRDGTQVKNQTVEIVVKVSVNDGRARRESVSIEKVRVSRGTASRTWESETYRQLSGVVPHKLYITTTKPHLNVQTVSARIDDQELKYNKSGDRMNAIYGLAKRARNDYLNSSQNGGWVSALELAERLWQIRMRNGAIEISEGIKTEMARAIERWARHLAKSGKLILSDDVKLDHDYINSEILVPDLDIKKKIVDLVHKINQDEKYKRDNGFQLIESRPGLGYRINFHPALIFITELDSKS